jgi:hypothetical protein
VAEEGFESGGYSRACREGCFLEEARSRAGGLIVERLAERLGKRHPPDVLVRRQQRWD